MHAVYMSKDFQRLIDTGTSCIIFLLLLQLLSYRFSNGICVKSGCTGRRHYHYGGINNGSC